MLVEKIQAESTAARQAAEDIKADVAVKDEFAAALEVHNRALKEKEAGDLEKAGADFAQARDMFDAAYETASAKREAALKAIQQTDEALVESEQKAADAQEALDSEGVPVQGGN